MSVKKEQLEAVLMPLEQYMRRNICLDEASPFCGGLLETLPHTPNPVWSHSSYTTADAYLRLYESYEEVSYRQMATVMIEFLVREQNRSRMLVRILWLPKRRRLEREKRPTGEYA